MVEAILARHGESVASERGIVNGDPAADVPLTERGRGQARRLGELLRGEPIEVCLVSELRRTRETAELALEGRRIPIEPMPELNDIVFGDYEGRTLADYRGWITVAGPAARPEGGESRAETVLRFVGAIRKILERPEALVLVVTHGLPIRYLLDAQAGNPIGPLIAGVGHADPHRFTHDELEAAVARLSAWAAAPSW
jgi:broad specificity phosphatase PhoE